MPLYKDIKQESDLRRNRVRTEAYRRYLQAVAEYLPEETRAFALSDWYYSDFHRCPHDAWVESVEIGETSSGERQQIREPWIHIRLLSASHAGHIHFHYEKVIGYRLEGEQLLARATAHGDWLADELTLGSDGLLVHEILFLSGTAWSIECSGIRYEYVPISGKDQTIPHARSRQS
jgi:hypothetical protein